MTLSQAKENIRDLGGVDQDVSLGLMMEDLEKDAGEWHCLNDSDLTLLVEEELNCLSNQMQKAYVEK